MMKILVVGGAGYIGGAVVELLMKRRIPFTVFDNLIYRDAYVFPIDFIFGDITDKKKLKLVLQTYTHVIWLAAIVGDKASDLQPSYTKAVNTQSVAWLSKHYFGRILYSSTCSVYGINKEIVNEESKKNPLSLYAQSKLAAEKFLESRNALVFRIGTAYGDGGQYSRVRMDLAINYMTANAVRFSRIDLRGGDQYRPFIHVKDIAEVLVNNLGSSKKGIYNLISENTTMAHVAAHIRKAIGRKIIVRKQQNHDNRSYHVSVEKAIKDGIYSLSSLRHIQEGIIEIKRLVESRRINNIHADQFSNEKMLKQRIKNA